MMSGYTFFYIGHLSKLGVSRIEIFKFVSLMSLGSIQQGLLWWLTTLVIEIWLQRFIDDCKGTKSVKCSGEYFLDTYDKLERSLKGFFLFFYSASQIYLVVATFLSFSTFLTSTSIELPQLLSLFGLMLSTAR